MFWMVRLVVVTVVLFFCDITVAQYLSKDQIPLEIQRQIIDEVIAEHGYPDMAVLGKSFREWLRADSKPGNNSNETRLSLGGTTIDQVLPVGGRNLALRDCVLSNGHLGSDPVANVDVLDCPWQSPDPKITQLAELVSFTALEILNIDDHDVCDISSLVSLPLLEELNLSRNEKLVTGGIGFECPFSGRFDPLQSMDALLYLFLDDLGLTTIPTLSSNTANGYITVSLKNNLLGTSTPTASCPVVNDPGLISVGFMDVSSNGMTDVSTLHLAPFRITSLKASSNQFSDVQPSSCTGSLSNVHGLDISNNNFPLGKPDASFDLRNIVADGELAAGGEMINDISFIMNDTNAIYLPRRLPNACASIWLQGNIAVKELVQGNNSDFPIRRPGNLFFSDSTSMACSHVDEVIAWNGGLAPPLPSLSVCNSIEILEPSFIRPSSCLVDLSPEEFNVARDTSTGLFYISWEASPAAWGDVRYELRYRQLGTTTFTIDIINDDSETSRIYSNLNPEEHYEFSISACNQNQSGGGSGFGNKRPPGCSDWSALQSPDDFLAPVANIAVVWVNPASGVFKLEWDYSDFYFGAQRPDRFEISNLDSDVVLDNVNVGTLQLNQHPWESDDNFVLDTYSSNIFQITACSVSGCGPTRSVTVIPPPVIDGSFTPPLLSTPIVNNANATLVLSWTFSDVGNVIDYFKVTEYFSGSTAPVAEYFVDKSEAATSNSVNMTLKRGGGEHEFTIQACHRDRYGADSCSNPSALRSGTLDSVPLGFAQIPDEDVCYLENPPGSVFAKVGWEYSGGIQPSYFKGVLDSCTECSGMAGQQFIQDNDNPLDFLVETDSGGNPLFKGMWDIYACSNNDYCLIVADNINAGDTIDPNNFAQQCDTPSQVFGGTTPGGPGDLTPGIWWNEDYRGSGWYFYWANRLQNDETHSEYGNTYDLIAFWATYRLFDGNWQPAWVYSKLKFDGVGAPGQGTYRGDLVYPKSGGIQNHENIGHIEVILDDNGLIAPVTVNLQANKEGGLSTFGIDNGNGPEDYFSIELNNIIVDLLDQPVFTDVNRYDHLSGLWSPCLEASCFAQDVLLLNFIRSAFDGNTLFFYDITGEPIWVNATSCVAPVSGSEPDCDTTNYSNYSFPSVHTIEFGINPLQTTPLSFVPSERRLLPTGGASVSRTFGTGMQPSETEQATGSLSANLTFNFAENLRTASINNTFDIKKRGNLSDIRYFIDGSSTPTNCEIENAECIITLTWYTDGPYPALHPRYIRVNTDDTSLDNNHRPAFNATLPVDTALCSTVVDDPEIGNNVVPKYSEEQYECFIDNSGNYRFYLFNQFYDAAGNVVLDPVTNEPLQEAVATSKVLTITGSGESAAEVRPQGDPVDPNLPINPSHGLTQAEIEASAQTGATQGQFSVDGSGAAVYNIPVYTVPATGDVAPQFALSYNSQTTVGVAGRGWTISGLSMISRCGNTYELDGFVRGVQLDGADRYCMDGQRLVAINGDYGADGTEYRTEIDNISRIHSYGSSVQNGPEYFKVEGKDGSTSFYGDWCADSANAAVCPSNNLSNDSSISVPGMATLIYAWTQDFTQDSAGNYIRYSWVDQTGDPIEVLLQKAEYTGNKDENLNPYASIEFDYAGLPADEVRISYIAGVPFQQTQYLNKIESIQANDVLRRYKLVYETAVFTPESRYLASVQECTDNNNNELCFDPVEFTWLHAENGIDVSNNDCTQNDTDPNCFDWDDSGWSDFEVNAVPIDFLGNGQQEIMVVVDDDYDCRDENDRLTSPLTYSLDMVSYTTENVAHHVDAYNDIGTLPCHVYPQGYDQFLRPNRYGPQFWTGDYNADSYQDVMYLDDADVTAANPNGNNVGEIMAMRTIPVAGTDDFTLSAPQVIGELQCANVSTFSLSLVETIRQADVNGDGLADLIYSCGFGHATYLKLHNGDTGVTDMPYGDKDDFTLLFNNDLGGENLNINFTVPPGVDPGNNVDFTGPSAVFDKDSSVIDYNGDGAVDLLINVSSTYCEHDGTSCDPPPECDFDGCDPQTQPPAGFGSSFEIHEFSVWYVLVSNGDGTFNNALTEPVLYQHCDSVYPDCVAITNPITGAAGPISNFRYVQFSDANNDQLSDLIYRTGSSSSHQWQLAINTGAGLVVDSQQDLSALEGFTLNPHNSTIIEPIAKYLNYVDFDGNGFVDILYAGFSEDDCGGSAYGSPTQCSQWNMLLNDGGQFNPTPIINVAVAGDLESSYDSSIFVDVNADGLTDHIYLDGAQPLSEVNPRLQGVYVALASNCSSCSGNDKSQPNDVITGIATGIGMNTADTVITYGLMTDRAVYSRGNTASNLNYGSVVYDLIPTGYLVQQVDTDSPASGHVGINLAAVDINAQSSVRYYYEAARIQAGGRGFLGFELVHSFDVQNSILSTSQYHQEFPFTGNPWGTATWFVPAGESLPWEEDGVIPPCESCLPPPPNCPLFDPECQNPQRGAGEAVRTFSENYILLSDAITEWSSYSPTASEMDEPDTEFPFPAIQYTRTWTPEIADVNGNLVISAQGPVTQMVVTTNDYATDAHGNLQGSTVETFDYDCSDTNCAGTDWYSSITTANSYVDNTVLWHLGRLANSTVTHNRADAPPITRTSEFDYDSVNGILTDEWVEKNTSLEVHTQYELDDFGNRVKTTLNFRNPDGTNAIARVTRQEYDGQGRFVDKTFDANDVLVSQVTGRDNYGNPTSATSVNGVVTDIVYDPMGRALFTSDDTGAFNLVTYKAGLATVNFPDCPSGTMYHSSSRSDYNESSASGSVSPASVTCYDILGRETRTITEHFKSGQHLMADTRYDSSGRTLATSRPMIIGLETEPSNTSTDWVINYYDALSRVWRTRNPDMSEQQIQFGEFNAGTSTWNGLITVYTNELGQQRTQINNVLGETGSVTDALQGVITYAYDSTGNLISTDGTAANDATSMVYNKRGHKTSMFDPDKGNWQYSYNSLGELICQMDANGDGALQTYDNFGRLIERREYRELNFSTCTGAVTTVVTSNWDYDNAHTGMVADNPNSYGQLLSTGVSGFNLIGTTVQELNHQVAYEYDSFGRVIEKVTSIDNVDYYERTSYDEVGRLFQQFSAHRAADSPIGQRFWYNERGYLYAVSEAAEGLESLSPNCGAPNQYYQCMLELDRWNNISMQYNGEGNLDLSIYNDLTTRMDYQSTERSGVLIYAATYQFDELGNLTARASIGEGRRDLEEVYEYDLLNRLTDEYQLFDAIEPFETLDEFFVFPASNDPDIVHKQFRYDGQTVGNLPAMVSAGPGNLTYKAGTGQMHYGTDPVCNNSAGPHAVCATSTAGGTVTSSQYSYDANGNQTSASTLAGNRAIAYTASNHPWKIDDSNGQTTIFAYDSDRNRYKREDVGQQLEHTVGNTEILQVGMITYRYTLSNVIMRFAPLMNDTGSQTIGNSDRTWITADHLGSAVVSQTFNVALGQWEYSHRHFQPFGSTLNLNDSSNMPLLAQFEDWTEQGFTGHENIVSADVIHMGGRIYDPSLGRFLQADPFIQTLENSQNLNRYTYVLNNPLSYTDPSGYFFSGVRHVVGIARPYLNVIGCAFGPYACAAVTATTTYISTLSLSETFGALGATGVQAVAFSFAAGVTSNIAIHYGGTGKGLQGLAGGDALGVGASGVALHAAVGGLFAEAQGGSFVNGALSSGLSKGFSLSVKAQLTYLDAHTAVLDNLLVALIGGTISEITGGRFSNGALTSALAYTFNQESATETPEEAVQKSIENARKLRLRLAALYENRHSLEGVHEALAGYYLEDFYGGVESRNSSFLGLFGDKEFIAVRSDLSFIGAGNYFVISERALVGSFGGPNNPDFEALIINVAPFRDFDLDKYYRVLHTFDAPVYVDDNSSVYFLNYVDGEYSCSIFLGSNVGDSC